jgi:hypothetical protein
MKNGIFLLLIIIASLSFQLTPIQSQATVSYQIFYDELSPYGYWVSNPDYGYVWVPNAGSGFIPYASNGYWLYTDYGWSWVSNYPWGWAPFHYGRWTYDSFYGPVWVPGYEWSPGWVVWRYGEGYYGWTAMGPSSGIELAYTTSVIPTERWIFVPESYLGNSRIHRHYVKSSRNVTIINQTTVVNNTREDPITNVRYYSGPNKSDVERRNGQLLQTVMIRDSKSKNLTPSKKEWSVFRPQIKNSSNDIKSAPAKYQNWRQPANITRSNTVVKSTKDPVVIKERQVINNQTPVRKDPQQIWRNPAEVPGSTNTKRINPSDRNFHPNESPANKSVPSERSYTPPVESRNSKPSNEGRPTTRPATQNNVNWRQGKPPEENKVHTSKPR